MQATEELLRALSGLKLALRKSGASVPDAVERTSVQILARIRASEGMRLSDVGKEMCIDVSTASRHCTDLINEGFLERRDDPNDRRASLLYITAKGRSFIEEVMNQFKSVFDRALESWSDTDKEMLIALITRLNFDLSGKKTTNTGVTGE